MKKALRSVPLLVVLALLAGCSKAPQTETANADRAIQSAASAQAAKYAPVDWGRAQDTLRAAQIEKAAQDSRFALFRSYSRARTLFEKAAELAASAKTNAEAGMARVSAETQQILAAVNQRLDSAEAKLAAAPVGTGTKAELDAWKQDLAALTQMMADAQSDFERGGFDAARGKAQTVGDRCSRMESSLAAALGRKREVVRAEVPPGPAKIEWLTYDVGVAKARMESKPIIIDFTASWCGWCKKMERETFSDPRVVRYMRESYVPIKVWGDDTTRAAMVSHNGERMTQQALSSRVYAVRGFPTFWFLDPQGGRIGPQSGYRAPEQFLPLIEYVGGNHYKTMSYENFLQKRSGKG